MIAKPSVRGKVAREPRGMMEMLRDPGGEGGRVRYSSGMKDGSDRLKIFFLTGIKVF